MVRLSKYSSLFSFGLGLVILLLAYPVAHGFFFQEADIEESPYLRNDPEKMEISARDARVPCGECHTLEFDVWEETPHAQGFDEMHRSTQAQGILERMDFRLAKRESLCLRCHYTATIQRDEARAIAGVSCESCHGAARDWLDIHNDLGDYEHDTEPAEHKAQRIQASVEGGMLRPSDNLYGVAANCFECHTVPSERLVDVGKHASGSDFELVEWSERIRHNFLEAQWSNNENNRMPTAERHRMMYVIGRMLDYEYSVRGMAEATESGRYAKSMERRVASAVLELDKIAFIADISEVDEVLQNHKDIQLIPNNQASLLAAAENVRTLGQQFTTTRDGSQIAEIDRLIAGEVVNVPRTPEPTASAAAQAPSAAGEPGDPPSPEAPPSPAETPAAAAPPPTPAFEVAGEKRTRPAWFEAPEYDVTLANCARCHIQADEWLLGDPHYSTTQDIHAETAEAVRIASNYGLSRAEMKLGNQICMSCHGTVVTGQEAGQVFDGVTCESCHGPSSGYEKPHRKDRSRGFELGMVELKNAATLAGNCSRCHHITDERLISSGHPTGDGYNVGTGIQSIQHWPDDENVERDGPYPEVDVSAVQSAFAGIQSSRPIPQVEVAPIRVATPAVAATTNPPAAAPSTSSPRPAPTIDNSATATVSAPPRPPRPRQATRIPPPPTASSSAVNLPALPEVTDSTSTEDILLLVKERLELLYKELGRNE